MMKQILIAVTIILIVIALIYFNLPFEITRKADIDFGNEIVSKIELFKNENQKLPETDDWKILEELGFKTKILGTDPTYQKINEKEFELIFLKGFDAPYLMYNSESNIWTMGFSTVPQ